MLRREAGEEEGGGGVRGVRLGEDIKCFISCFKISSSKGAIGHLLGGAGAVESAFTVLACHTGLVPPTANLHNTDSDLQLVAGTAVPWIQSGSSTINSTNSTSTNSNSTSINTSYVRRIALKNSFGFGGTNACICFASYDTT